MFEVERRRAAGGRGQQFRPRHTAADDAVVWTLPPAGRGQVSPLPAVKWAIKNQDLVVGVAGENDADRLTSLHRCTPLPRGALVRRGAVGGRHGHARAGGGHRGVWPRPRTRRRRFQLAGYARA